MDIDRIQPVTGLKVERTGSEQERRRRRQTGEDFAELLESTLSEEQTEEEKKRKQQAREDKPAPAADTVSIAGNVLPTPLINDLVSISTTALVGAEMHEASRSVEHDESIDQLELHVPDAPLPTDTLTDDDTRRKAATDDTGDDDDENDRPANIDTLA